jgi:GNAT superfamily N-acetyltransferase
MPATAVQLRPFDSVQIPLVVELWNRAAGEAFPLREVVLRLRIDLNPSYRPLDAVAAWRGEKLIGWAMLGRYRGEAPSAARLSDQAWLTSVVVAPEEQRQGIGTRLVASLIEDSALPRDRIRPGGGIHFLFPGPPAELPAARPFLESLGFAFGREVYDLRTDLSAPEARLIPDPAAELAVRGLSVVPCRPDEVPRLLAFLAGEFPGGWWHDADCYFAAGGDAADWLVLRAGERVVGMARVHHPASQLIGPALFWAPLRGPRAGGLGPIGVAAARRGEGLGKLLLAATLDRLRSLGADDAVADWTDLLGYYGPFGFQIWKSYVTGR